MGNDPNYVFIGGTTKAGTTSLFEYLSAHPDICGSSVKETGFFLDKQYPFPHHRMFHYLDGFEKFFNFFEFCKECKIWLEATPTYLYSPGTPSIINRALNKKIKWIFILREPVSRLVSCYWFGQQIGDVPINVDFREYVDNQFRYGMWAGSRCLETGRYSLYLEKFLDFFPRENIAIISYSVFANDPSGVVRGLCDFIGISSSFYNYYKFKSYNPTRKVRRFRVHNWYLYLGKKFSHRRFSKRPYLRRAIITLSEYLTPIYFRLNSNPVDQIDIPEDLQNKLEDYYKEELTNIANLFNLSNLSW